MDTSPSHDNATPSAEASDLLRAVDSQIGFVPNIFSTLSISPPVLSAFVELNRCFGASSLSPDERETVQLAASVERGSSYCVAGHTRFAHDQRTNEAVIEALRTRSQIESPRLDALATFTRTLIATNGRPSRSELDRFFAVGFGLEQVLEVILGICVKTLSNLATNATDTSLDEPFAPFEWQQRA